MHQQRMSQSVDLSLSISSRIRSIDICSSSHLISRMCLPRAATAVVIFCPPAHFTLAVLYKPLHGRSIYASHPALFNLARLLLMAKKSGTVMKSIHISSACGPCQRRFVGFWGSLSLLTCTQEVEMRWEEAMLPVRKSDILRGGPSVRWRADYCTDRVHSARTQRSTGVRPVPSAFCMPPFRDSGCASRSWADTTRSRLLL